MRRDTLLTALANVKAALEASSAHQVLSYLGSRSKSEDTLSPSFVTSALSGYAQFMIAYNEFGNEEKKILEDFGFLELKEASTWITPTRPEPRKPTVSARIRYYLETAEPFFKLLTRQADIKEIIVQDTKTRKPIQTKKLTFIIREQESPTLTLSDFSSIISDIENAFQTILKINSDPPSDLIILALDSGSDKSIDVAGIAGAVEKFSNFLLEVWDRVRFARANKVRASIKTASDGLTLLNELRAAQEKGALSAEEAEKLKRVLLKSVDDLFAKGVYTREMQDNVPLRPNEVEYHRVKQITHYSDAKVKQDVTKADDDPSDDDESSSDA